MSQMTLNSSIVVASLTIVGRTVSEVPSLMRGRDGRACPRPTLNSSIVVASLTVVGRTVSEVPSLMRGRDGRACPR